MISNFHVAHLRASFWVLRLYVRLYNHPRLQRDRMRGIEIVRSRATERIWSRDDARHIQRVIFLSR
jgi:hypothetical protein